MERKIGEQFMYKNMLLKVVKSVHCKGCVFDENFFYFCERDRSITGECGRKLRVDRTYVKFVRVDDRKEESWTAK